MKMLLPIIIVLTLIGGYFAIKQTSEISYKPPQVSSPSPKENLKTFKSSSVMKFSIQMPENYQIEEKFGGATINTPSGQIFIDKNGTNLNDLDEFIKNSKNNIDSRLKSREQLTINGLQTVKGNLEDQKIYFIYNQFMVYMIYTKTEALYNTLDQIAQSFRYTP